MTLHMLSFSPDIPRFSRFAARERLLPAGDDTGYAWHAVLAATFGAFAPKPFIWLAPRTPQGGQQGRLLGYSIHSLDTLRSHAAAFADPVFLDVLRIDDAASKAMPATYTEERSYGFQVRVRPTIRTGAGRDGQRAKERDAFDPSGEIDRATCYSHWLETALARNGAALCNAHIQVLRMTTLLARSRREEHSQRRSTLGPDATFTGTLRVTDAASFASLMERGLGRHRAFGFGMILLRPH
jgi:CRISPR system Cascade subunit CasE